MKNNNSNTTLYYSANKALPNLSPNERKSFDHAIWHEKIHQIPYFRLGIPTEISFDGEFEEGKLVEVNGSLLIFGPPVFRSINRLILYLIVEIRDFVFDILETFFFGKGFSFWYSISSVFIHNILNFYTLFKYFNQNYTEIVRR